MNEIKGLHHVTAISGSAQGNLDFFAGLLGLRLVKKTVNFDDPGTYHLYFGDGVGTPGSALTFFPWEGVRRGRPGTGETSETQFAAPAGSLDFWEARLQGANVPVERQEAFGGPRLRGADPDGFVFAITEAPDDARAGWSGGTVDAAAALKGFAGVTLSLADREATAELLTGLLGYRETGREGATTRYENAAGAAGILDIVERPGASPAGQGAGRVHHIAFRVADRAAQLAAREALVESGFDVTPVIDRNYFWSIYFRSPGGVLFEVATDEPGFTADEPVAELGANLKLPPQHEHLRPLLEQRLPPLRQPAPVSASA
jgi:glyoxalase family protein